MLELIHEVNNGLLHIKSGTRLKYGINLKKYQTL